MRNPNPFWHGRPPHNRSFPKGLKAELARELGTTPSYIGCIFTRRRRAGIDMALRLQTALKNKGFEVTIDEILDMDAEHPLFK